MSVAGGRSAGSLGPPRLEELLVKTSRTFALTIPLLPEPTRSEVTVAYLLFRVADTLEDATSWPASRKEEELEAFGALLADPTPAHAAARSDRWAADPPLRHPGYLELLVELPRVLRAAAELRPEAGRRIFSYTRRTTAAMRGFVVRERDGALRLRDVADLKEYCYAVAGIVGELLTELFLLERPALAPVAAELRREAPEFGEALQLVNILKDSSADSSEGRHFLPREVAREEIFDLARRDLEVGARYCARIEATEVERGIVGFNVLPLQLARATLDRLEERGAGAKLTRAEVGALVGALHEALPRRGAAALLGSSPPRPAE